MDGEVCDRGAGRGDTARGGHSRGAGGAPAAVGRRPQVSESAHAHAVASLERCLAAVHPGDFQQLVEFRCGVLDPLVELGVLSAGEAIEWRRRFERAAQPLDSASPETRARAREMLERELKAGDVVEPGPGEPLARRERFIAKLRALRETGAVGSDERRHWVERLDRAVPAPAKPSLPPAYEGRELVAVALGPKQRLAGLRVNSAELYDDCVILRWHLVVEATQEWHGRVFIADHGKDLARAHGPSSLEDDLGTSYVAADGPWDGLDWFYLDQDPEVLPGATAFVPGVPAQATRLSVGSAGGNFELGLPTVT